MTVNIAELKKLAEGTEVAGLPLLIKTARKTFADTDNLFWQEVVFMDATGEIIGHVLMDSEAAHFQSKTRLCIMKATIQPTDAGHRGKEANKLVVTECFDMAVKLSYDQVQGLDEIDWEAKREAEIRGKIRHGIVCACIQGQVFTPGEFEPDEKLLINALVEFIMTGE